MTREKSFTLKTGPHELSGVVHLPDRPGRRPVAVICHGFKGFMEWGFFPPLAELLADRGFVAVRFNFSGSGMAPGDELVTDLDAFAHATFSRDLEDLLTLLGAVGNEIAPGVADPEKIGLVGHSRGGATAVLAAAHDAWKDRLGALVTWAAVASYAERYDTATRKKWRADGELEIVNGRTGQKLPMNVSILDDLDARGEELEPIAQAGEVQAPWLVIHGEGDEAVPANDAKRLHARATTEKDLLILPETGHTFGARHPFAGPTAELTRVLNATQTWLKRHLQTS